MANLRISITEISFGIKKYDTLKLILQKIDDCKLEMNWKVEHGYWSYATHVLILSY